MQGCFNLRMTNAHHVDAVRDEHGGNIHGCPEPFSLTGSTRKPCDCGEQSKCRFASWVFAEMNYDELRQH